MLQLCILKKNGDLINLGGYIYNKGIINNANYTTIYLLAKNKYNINQEPSEDLKFVFIDGNNNKQAGPVYYYESKEKYLEDLVEYLNQEITILKNQLVNLEYEISSLQ